MDNISVKYDGNEIAIPKFANIGEDGMVVNVTVTMENRLRVDTITLQKNRLLMYLKQSTKSCI